MQFSCCSFPLTWSRCDGYLKIEKYFHSMFLGKRFDSLSFKMYLMQKINCFYKDYLHSALSISAYICYELMIDSQKLITSQHSLRLWRELADLQWKMIRFKTYWSCLVKMIMPYVCLLLKKVRIFLINLLSFLCIIVPTILENTVL